MSANGAVTANDLVALSFTSATEGVALVAGGPRRCSVRMAVSHDGGSSWKATGTALWANAPTAQAQVVAVSARHVWASRPDGPLLETRDGGRRWDAQPVPTPVEQLAVAGGTVWALSCPPVGVQATNTCAPIVERQPVRGGAWRRVTLPVTSVLSGPACRW